MSYKTCFSVIVLASLLLAGWQDGAGQRRKRKHGAPTNKMSKLQAGTWGGPHIAVDVSENGARLEYDCAHGTIDEPIVPDRDGRFDVKGTHVKEHGGPVRADEDMTGQPARYTGRAEGQTLTLTVTLTDTNEVVGTYTVALGQRPRIVKCL
jgi:hypothetical protein